MATVEAIPEGAEGSVLEATQQDFLQEAKSLIAQHYKRINENKPQVTSINVFKNKQQKPKTGRFIPFEIKKSEILDIVQEHRMILRSINYPKETFKCPPSKEDSEQISSSKPHVLNLKEKYQPEDPLQKEQVKLGKIITDIESVSKKMEKEKQLRLKKPRMLESFHSHVGLNLQNLTSSLGHLRGPAEKMLYDWRSFAWRRSSRPPHESTQSLAGSSGIFKDYYMALYHGPNLKAVIMMYQFLIYRIRHRLGLWRTRQIINFGELEEWMDRKKFYETMFAKREDWQGLERSELMKYFNDCGHFPTQSQMDEYWDLFHRHSQGKYSEVIKKSNAIELLFTLYPPQGARVNISTRLRSTWLRPIVDGEEGYKYIVSGHPILKRANIQTAGKLVANSIRERKMRQFYKS
ncbi:IQ domain-containing protein M isoform X2 [Peromyscus eremicus]|uniref:IQ domain-containing protein M isoform X2 n=1 Tax=Peromyscus eremicus TaxID=42410 RepID=UPI0027DAF30A|nr:IQ domain-containing protein M isoform X2 [Peromyscus eremicus]